MPLPFKRWMITHGNAKIGTIEAKTARGAISECLRVLRDEEVDPKDYGIKTWDKSKISAELDGDGVIEED